MALAGPHSAKGNTGNRPQRLTVLGATGSIGASTLDLVARSGTAFEVFAVTANANVEALATCARDCGAERAVIGDATLYKALKDALSGTSIVAAAGEEALIEAASVPVDCTIAAIVGAAGLKPALAAVQTGRRLGLANKECLVSAGDVFMQEVARTGCELIPVDSEHSAAFQVLKDAAPESIERIVLTASGGPFRDWPIERIATATRADALNHPNWSMGSKITVDSATMMNKGLELIEALHLFPVATNQLGMLVHPQSIVHCLVSFVDGSVLAQMAEPDMRTPIALALSWPQRMAAPTKRLDLAEISQLTFEAADEVRFPAIRIARAAMERGGTAPAVLNAANEIAVAAFLDGRLRVPDIAVMVEETLGMADREGLLADAVGLEAVIACDHESRRLCRKIVAGRT
ncbi:MAG: 1-deoxy-D-xylulose 5-phosphate reductoisomerase [Alphaproteobacteria bacterium BRH_c36]|nr:MAG: 1-deoxy-D-xylulose 5-phosphate reductoisomerase [Alphaproteobacteria bacterium BRH_c36]